LSHRTPWTHLRQPVYLFRPPCRCRSISFVQALFTFEHEAYILHWYRILAWCDGDGSHQHFWIWGCTFRLW
jgi:hypothetical protein